MNIDSVKHLHKSDARKRWLSAVWALPACLLLVFACILSWFAYDEYTLTVEQEYRFLESHARIGDANISSLLRNMEQLLNRVAEERLALPASAESAFDARLAERKRQFPEIRALVVLDAAGRGVFSSNPSLKNFDSSKRDYFVAHLDAPRQSGFYISRPYKTSFGDQSIAFSIAIVDAEHRFQGVVVVGVDPNYFKTVLSQIKPDGDNSVATLFNREGDILFRVPGAEKYNGGSVAAGAPFNEHIRQAKQRTRHIGIAASDGVLRIFVLSRIGDTGLRIGVSRKFDDMMAHWRRNFVLRIFMLLIVAGVSLFIMGIAYRRQREVLKSKAFADLLIETGNVIVIGVDTEGLITIFNQTSERITGYRRDEVYGRNWSELLLPQRPYVDIWHMFQTHQNADTQSSGLEYAISTKDGRQRTISWQHTIIKVVNARAATIFFGVDITERKESEEQLRDARALAEAANLAKSQFLANMSHEIRTPMNGVLGMAQLALTDESNPKQRAYLKKILVAGQHLLDIIEDVLDFSKIEAGKMSLESANFDLNTVFASVGDQVQGKVKANGLRWVVSLGPRVPLQLCGDALRLRQVLLNFASNAVKFTSHGTVTIAVREIEQDNDSWLLHFEVQDTGIGMSEEEIGRLFQSFHQADNTITRKYGGTGLGLAISKRLIEQMGGKLGVTSEVGRGSTFWFDLRFEKGWAPAASRDGDIRQGRVSATTPTPDDAPFSLLGRSLLVVEDNPFNQQVLEEFLRDAGARAFFACNGQEALDLLLRESVACILMDVQMPVMDGLEATRRIRANPALAHIPIIATTANARHENHDLCLTAGMDDFITKPILFASLQAKLMKLLPPQETMPANPGSGNSEANQAAEAPNSDLVDLRILESTMGGRQKVYKLARSFIAISQANLQQIEAALEQQDVPALAALGHRLKSPAKTVGALGFAELCYALEQCDNQGDIEQARAIVVQLRPLLGRIIEEIEKQLRDYSGIPADVGAC